MSKHLPRFKRTNPVVKIQITDRNRAIIRLIHQHRFLRSNHIIDLIGDSSQQMLRRLQLLYHHSYLERPRAQLNYYHLGGSRHIVYGLGNKGAALLKQARGLHFKRRRWSEKNRAVGRLFLEHALLVSEVMVRLELACRARGNIQLITSEELLIPNAREAKREPFQWKISVEGGKKLGVIPDRVFALEFQNVSGQGERRYFFLEADRGTMPVIRNNLSQTSMYRKLLAYEATWSQSVLERRFGINRFRVITITTSKVRLQSLVNACSELERGKGLFLFAHRDVLHSTALLSAPLWRTGKGGEPEGLLD